VLTWAHTDNVVDAFAALGVSFLMFLAGYEIDLVRIKGRPLSKAVSGFGRSLVLAGAFSFVMVSSGFALNTLVIGLTLTTTALGTLLRAVRDADILNATFGGYVLAIGAFASGVVVRVFSARPDGEAVREKLDAIGFGFLVLIFSIVSGMNFDLHALTSSPGAFLRLPLFLAMFLVIRGCPLSCSIDISSIGRSVFRWPCSRRPPCRWWWSSPTSAWIPGACVRSTAPPWSAPACSRC
jgi:Kef-type K+ transport system membrane component KefB